MKKFFEDVIGALVSLGRLCVALFGALFRHSTRAVVKASVLRFVKRQTFYPAFFLTITPYMPLWASRAWGVEASVVTTWLLLLVAIFLTLVFAWWNESTPFGSRLRFLAFGLACALGFVACVMSLLVLYGILAVHSYVDLVQIIAPMFSVAIGVALLVDLASIWYYDKGNAD